MRGELTSFGLQRLEDPIFFCRQHETVEVYATLVDYQAHCACVEYIELTCPISSGFYVINVQLWQTTRQQNWLSSVCKLIYCPDTVLPQLGCKLRIVWIQPAQKGLKLSFTCKASHAQSCAKEMPLDRSTRCASARCDACSFGMHK